MNSEREKTINWNRMIRCDCVMRDTEIKAIQKKAERNIVWGDIYSLTTPSKPTATERRMKRKEKSMSQLIDNWITSQTWIPFVKSLRHPMLYLFSFFFLQDLQPSNCDDIPEIHTRAHLTLLTSVRCTWKRHFLPFDFWTSRQSNSILLKNPPTQFHSTFTIRRNRIAHLFCRLLFLFSGQFFLSHITFDIIYFFFVVSSLK